MEEEILFQILKDFFCTEIGNSKYFGKEEIIVILNDKSVAKITIKNVA